MFSRSKIEYWLNDEELLDVPTSEYWNNEKEEKKKEWYVVDTDNNSALQYIKDKGLEASFNNAISHLQKIGVEPKGTFLDIAAGVGYTSAIISKFNKIKYDICLISQYRSEIEEPSGCEGIQEYNLLQQFILKYINNNSINFVIVMNNHQPEKERLYYEKIFGSKATLIENKMEEFTTYFTMDESEIVVSMNSTASFEALGWGKKSFIFSLTGDLDFSFNRKFSNYLFMHNNSYNEFEKTISFIRKMDQKKYETLLKKDRTYFMNYNPKLPTHKFIRDKIISSINNNEVNN